ncbi:MAG: ATP-grasp fold amidoligase family protein, partial [Planctomycetia bacterium]
WWGLPGGWRNPASWRRPFHRVAERHQLRYRTWPIARWHCCDHWQRSLLNKWNSREFAAMHGVNVPELYWHGRRIGELPLDALPDYFVLRSAWGTQKRGTHVFAAGRDLLDDRVYARSELKAAMLREYGRRSRFPILAEQFMTTADGRHEQGVEYRFYCMRGHVALIQQVEHRGRIGRWRHYFSDWRPIDDRVNTERQSLDVRPRPARLDEMLDIAGRLGAACGTFMRVDLYETAEGCFFGEFSSTPNWARHFTPWADDYLGRLWQEKCRKSI